MSVKIFDKPETQDFLKVLSGLDKDGGNPRVKEIVHRLMSDLFKAIDDLDITPDEYWTGIAWLNEIGAAGQAGLISPGLGLDHFLDERLDAIDEELGIKNPTPRTIEGPLYVAGAPASEGFARLDDGRDTNGKTLIMHGTVYGADGKPLQGATVEVWHCDTRGFYSHFDPTGLQSPFNMRRTIVTDTKGCYKFQSIVPMVTASLQEARPNSCSRRLDAMASARPISTSSSAPTATGSSRPRSTSPATRWSMTISPMRRVTAWCLMLPSGPTRRASRPTISPARLPRSNSTSISPPW